MLDAGNARFGAGIEVVAVGSNTLRLFTIARMGSTGSHFPSALEKTSVQKIGGAEYGSEGAAVVSTQSK